MYTIKILKRPIFLLLAIVAGVNCLSQNNFPYGLNYQAIARDNRGNPLIEKDIAIQIQILQMDKDVLLWEERHYTTTNEFGLFQLIIGEGLSTEDGLVLNFESINWAKGPIGIKVDVDFGEGFLDMGQVKLQSVPYAFLADSAMNAPIPDMKLEQINDVSTIKPTKNQPLIWDGSNWKPGDSLKVSDLVIGETLKFINSDEINGIVSDPELTEVSHQTIPTSEAVKTYIDSSVVIQDLELVSGSTLRITNNASATEVNLAPFTGTNTDEQILELDNTMLSITNGNTVNLEGLIDDADADPANEIQDLTFNDYVLSLTNHPNPTLIDLSPLIAGEVDPVFSQSPAASITQSNLDNWDNMFLWGDHALAGYLTEESDPVFSSSVAFGITSTSLTNWNDAFSWGDHSLAGYLTEETDPVFSGSVASGITSTNLTNWNNAYSWGNHALVGYLTEETDPIFSSSVASGITSTNLTNWNNAFSWGDHALAGYLTEETDPIFSTSPASGISIVDINNWDEAFSWGNHALAGYLTVETDPIFSGSPAAGITSADITEWNNNSNYWSLNGNNIYVLNRHVGIGTSVPAASLHIANNDVVFTAPYSLPGSPDAPPVSGQGTRLMWYADKAAFRVGGVQGVQWNQNNIGNYSFAFGSNTIASGNHSFAGGIGTEATGNYSMAFGSYSEASGNSSIAIGGSARSNGIGAMAIGDDVQANGEYAVALGFQIIAAGRNSVALGINTRTYGTNYGATAMGFGSAANGTGATAMGYNSEAFGTGTSAMGNRTIATGLNSLAANLYTTSQSYASSVFGRYNVIAGDSVSWIATDPLFVIGNGSSSSTRNNALTVYKNGNTSIDGNVTANAFIGDGSQLTGIGGAQCLQWNNLTRRLSISGCAGDFFISDYVNDADSDPDNELQTLDQAYARGRIINTDYGTVSIRGTYGLDVYGNINIGLNDGSNNDRINFDDSTPEYLEWNNTRGAFYFTDDLIFSGRLNNSGYLYNYNVFSLGADINTPQSGLMNTKADLYVEEDLEVGETLFTENLTVTGTVTGINVNDADHDPTNEYQDLSISGNTLSITHGNSVSLPSGSGVMPGIAQGRSNSTIWITSTAMQDVITVTINIPAAGYIVLEASGQAAFYGTTSENQIVHQIDETSGGSYISAYHHVAGFNLTPNTDRYYMTVSNRRTYYKSSAGSYTFRWEALSEGSGTKYIWNPVLMATYFPTSYGSVTSIAVSEESELFEKKTNVLNTDQSGQSVTGSEPAYEIDLSEIEKTNKN